MARILVTDDDVGIVRLLEQALLQHGYEVVTCDGGERALEIAVQEKPDLIVLDAMMPRLDGYQVLWHLHDRPETREIPTIMLSARDRSQDVQQGLGLGAREYVVKPFALDDLLARVRNLLPRGASVPS